MMSFCPPSSATFHLQTQSASQSLSPLIRFFCSSNLSPFPQIFSFLPSLSLPASLPHLPPLGYLFPGSLPESFLALSPQPCHCREETKVPLQPLQLLRYYPCRAVCQQVLSRRLTYHRSQGSGRRSEQQQHWQEGEADMRWPTT